LRATWTRHACKSGGHGPLAGGAAPPGVAVGGQLLDERLTPDPHRLWPSFRHHGRQRFSRISEIEIPTCRNHSAACSSASLDNTISLETDDPLRWASRFPNSKTLEQAAECFCSREFRFLAYPGKRLTAVMTGKTA